MHDEPASGRLARWERRTELPLLAVSLVYLAGYAVRVLAWAAPEAWRDAALAVVAAAWAVFGADYAVRIALSGERWRFVRTHWLDSLVLLLPLLRPLRLVKLHSAVRRHRGGGGGGGLSLYARVMTYAGLAAVLLTFTAALTVYHQERLAPGATIRTFGDSVWWAVSAITTVGYGDVTPVTPLGRTVAVGLMVCGVALLGAVTGSFSSWLIEVFRREGRDAPGTDTPPGPPPDARRPPEAGA
ncbi:potassium channel family protein [Streptomyces sp. NRRL F-5126]|uniref:potassium channel family protein n=1 Tax=Streptomyces sp. NRRL F-5126 TaxID=1463857 RepID=UPI00055BAFF6|nr:potassium channel family protein [Streptomyces sp. NRRL F-5126]